MTNYTQFYVEKNSQTGSDVLVAFGLMRVLNDLLEKQDTYTASVSLDDKGGHYLISIEPELQKETIEYLRKAPISPIKAFPETTVVPKALEAKRPVGIPTVDWDAVTNYFQARQNQVAEDQLPPKPPHLDLLLELSGPITRQGYQGLLFNWWSVREFQPEIVGILLYMFSEIPNRIIWATDMWKQLEKAQGFEIGDDGKITGQQLFNPEQGMGQNEPKANKLQTDTKKKSQFWLLEWLKAVGFYEAAIVRLVGDKKTKSSEKDRKTYVVAPHGLAFADNRAIMEKFDAKVFSETSIFTDIVAVISYTKTLLDYLIEPERLEFLPRLGCVRDTIVSGFYSTYYKNLGKAPVTMSISFLALPGWVEVYSLEDVQRYKTMLDEIEKICWQLDESHGDENDLLKLLRDFISADNSLAFLEFCNSYAGFYMREIERNRKVSPISQSLVERIVQTMKKPFSSIADESEYPGFHAIARAISESTVWAQWRKTKQNNTTYQIRYGLNQELTRQSRSPELFLEALGEFIHTYNAETSRALELGRTPKRIMIEPSDIRDVLRMIDDFGGNSRMVAQLLIAYGYTFNDYRRPNTSEE